MAHATLPWHGELVDTLQRFVEHFTYLGIFAVLLLASLGLPIPEEVPIVAGAVLAHEGLARWWLALPVCVTGVLSGDIVLYWAGRYWGERVLGWQMVRLVLNREREERLTAAYRRNAVKTIVAVRHVMGLRAAAFLTAGIAHVPFWKFLAADGGAVLVGVPLTFGLAYFFTDQLEAVLADVRRVERWVTLFAVVAAAAALVLAARRRSRRGITGD
jgi:membrane protein DedA with SNARE-associated domain